MSKDVEIRPAFGNCPVKKTRRCKYKVIEVRSITPSSDIIKIEVLITKECIWCGWKYQVPRIVEWKD